jgi:hypothetical protein
MATAALADDKPKPARKHSDGPLAVEDFEGKPDPSSSFAAWSHLQFEFSFGYRFERLRGGRVSLSLTKIDVWSQIKRDQSWIRRPKDPLLLDHEQGHFDIAEAHALAGRIKLRTLIQASAPQLTLQADSEEAGRQAMHDKLVELLKPFIDDSRTANQEYDRDTANGTDAAAQADARKQQRERLHQLHKELEKLTKAE